ncbi:MAG: hypothetical protein L0216_01435 [Planctomycetales bacterium]|nr:hypothetical protein [Planctomycetales bacterium]
MEPTRFLRFASAAVLLLALAAAAAADVVRLKDGRTVRGAVSEAGEYLLVATPAGEIRVLRSEVEGVDREASPADVAAEYARRRGAVAEGEAASWVALGQWCRGEGLALEGAAAFERAVALDTDHPEARAALGHVRFRGRWMTEAEAMVAKGFVRYRGKWVLPAERDYLRRRDGVAADAPDPPAEPAAAAPGSFAADLRALGSADPAIREAAARRLATRREIATVRALTRAAVADPDASVRSAALSSLHAIRYENTPLYLGSALRSRKEAIRTRAAEALGTFAASPLAPRVLAGYAVEGWGGGPRVNIFIGQQTAYIRDFEVEVAQTAAIADPIVGVIMEGTVLDFQCLGIQELISVSEKNAATRAWENLTGQKSGDPQEWARWLATKSEGAAEASTGPRK